MTDFAEFRRIMVNTQIRPADVTKYSVIDAMLRVPRERFVPGAMQSVAYVEDMIDLAPDRIVLEPRTFAKTLDTLDIRNNEMVLDIGCGLGYSTAVMAQMAQVVVGVEEISDLATDAQSALADTGIDNAVLHEGPLVEGAPEHGPYDVIVIEGGVEEVPNHVTDQLKDGGRMAALFIEVENALGSMRIGHKSGNRISWRFAFQANAPVLAGFAKSKSFSF